MTLKYKVAYGLGVKELEAEVNKLTGKGWVTDGSLVAIPLAHNTQFFQAMVKYTGEHFE
jgi:hypothetical protein